MVNGLNILNNNNYSEKNNLDDFEGTFLPYTPQIKQKIEPKVQPESLNEDDLIESGEIRKPSFNKPMNNNRGYVTEIQARKMIDYYKLKAKKNKELFNLSPRPVGINDLYSTYIRNALLIFTLWYSGRRISEIIGVPPFDRCPGLRPDDIDYDSGLVTFSILKKNPVYRRTKKGKKRDEEVILKDKINKEAYLEQKPMPKHWFQVMKFWIEKLKISQYERIFPTTRNNSFKIIRKAAEDCKLKLPGSKYFRVKGNPKQIIKKPFKIHPHAFRHGYSIKFLELNKNDMRALPMLQTLLSHRDINTTKTYLNYSVEDLKDPVQKMDYKLKEVNND